MCWNKEILQIHCVPFDVRSTLRPLTREVFIGQGVGAVVAVPSSRISDLVGCKPMVYVSCLVQCAP